MTSRRLPVIAFGLLVIATVAAFFLIQAVKVKNPLVWNSPQPVPASFDPIAGRVSGCVSSTGQALDYRRTQITLAVSHADSVGVYIVAQNNAGGSPVATISSGTPMRAAPGPAHPVATQRDSRVFTWDGHLADGAVAPDGTYFFRVVLQHEGRSINLSDSPVQVVTQPPQARVTSVQMLGSKGRAHGPLVFTPPHGEVRINYTRGNYRRLWVDIYRTDVSGKPERVDRFAADRSGSWARWNGEIGDQPAPPGTYLIGLTAQNLACDQARWPVVMPPAADSTPGAGVSIRYLTVTPPLTPTVSGSRASVAVYSPASGFVWKLRRAGSSRVIAHGTGVAGASHINVRMPRHHPGLYTLVVRSGTQSAAVPLVASQAGAVAARAHVLVVLPMLSWMGNTPVDDTGDGVPDTLRAGDSVSLDRPMVNGLPASLGDDAALLNFLSSQHRSYQLTTDVALAEGRGPSLVDRWGVVFPDGEDYLPASLGSTLSKFVRYGGRVLTLGTGTFNGLSHLSGFPSSTRAGVPTPATTDPFGAQRGPLTPTSGALITELTDELGLFDGAVAFTGFSQYQPIEPPSSAGANVSAAGIASGSPAIVGFSDGSGKVVEVGLPNFGASLPHDIDSQELLDSVWRVLAKQR